MKKHIILAVVVVVALVAAATGGVFATWSDSETSMNNIVRTGAVDLKVNGADDIGPNLEDPLWGEGVPSKVEIECMVPDKFYGPYEVELWHAGQCTFPAHAFIEFKDLCCGNVLPKVNPYPDGGSQFWPAGETTGYRDPVSGDLKPEPELVAEYGGKVDCQYVDGVGVQGDTCTMQSNVSLVVTTVADPADISRDTIIIGGYDDEGNLEGVRLGTLVGTEMYLFDLEPCQPRMIYLWFHLDQRSEESFGLDYIPDPGDVGFDELYWEKFNDWPSWALMKDYVNFSMEFDLWLEDSPGGFVLPDGTVWP